MATLLIGYDVEGSRFEDIMQGITGKFLQKVYEVHIELKTPCTLFVLGKTLESNIDAFKFPIGGEFLGVKTNSENSAIAGLLNPTRYYCDFYGKETGYPGLIVNKYGKGKVVYIPGEIGLTYYEKGFIEHRDIINNAIRWMAGDSLPVETDLPETVEVSLMETSHKPGMVIHLVNCTADLSCPVEKVFPVSQCRIKVKLPHSRRPKKVFSLCNKSRLRYYLKGDRIVISLPVLHEYECVIVEFMEG